MGWLFGRKKDDVLDLTERYKKQQERLARVKEESSETSSSPASGGFGIFGMQSSSPSVSTSSSDSSYVNVSETDEKRRRLAKRFMDMTDKLEDLNNQIYHLQQRVEVLEKKAGAGRF